MSPAGREEGGNVRVCVSEMQTTLIAGDHGFSSSFASDGLESLGRVDGVLEDGGWYAAPRSHRRK